LHEKSELFRKKEIFNLQQKAEGRSSKAFMLITKMVVLAVKESPNLYGDSYR
jgi:hypothetical protein